MNCAGLGSVCPEQSSNTIAVGSALAVAWKSRGRPKYTQEPEITVIYLCEQSLRGEMGLHRGDGLQHHPRAQKIQITTL